MPILQGGRGVLPQLHRLPGRGQPGRLRPHILSRSQSKSASGLGGQLCSFGRALVRLRSSFLPGVFILPACLFTPLVTIVSSAFLELSGCQAVPEMPPISAVLGRWGGRNGQPEARVGVGIRVGATGKDVRNRDS